MESVIVSHSCGLDVHQATVVACVLVQAGRKVTKHLRTFSTFTRELVALRDWLVELGVTHVGMESSGTYWKPVYAVLEEEPALTLIVGNAQHIKNVPGRKTDCNDAQWLATLVRMGLIRASFVPPKDLRELRDLLRFRRSVIEGRTAERNRLLKLLETANLKLSSVASDVFGQSGMAMLRALADGETDPSRLANLAKGQLRLKLEELRLALDGRFEPHHRFLLALQLERLAHIDQDVQRLDAEIDRRLLPYQEPMQRLMEIPGVKRTVAATVIAEVGVDMRVFPSAGHLAAWAGLCPGNYQSAGKALRQGTRKGNVHLRTLLVEAAQAARAQKGSYLRDKYFRLQARQGKTRAAVSIAHKILVAAYHLLRTGERYRDLGDSYLDRLDEQRTAGHLVRRLQRLGYEVHVHKPTEPVSSESVQSGAA